MKKSYTKPQLMLERFALTHMLTSCSVLIGNNNASCVLNDEDSPPALKDFALIGWFVGGCAEEGGMAWVGDDVIDGICIHASSNLMFTS